MLIPNKMLVNTQFSTILLDYIYITKIMINGCDIIKPITKSTIAYGSYIAK